MDGLLNTCHASLINIQSSPSRKCFPCPSAATMTTRQVESRLIFIDHRSRPRWHLWGPIHAPGHGPGPGHSSIRIRDGARRFTENIRIRRHDRRLTTDKWTGAEYLSFFFFLFSSATVNDAGSRQVLRNSRCRTFRPIECNLRIRSRPGVVGDVHIVECRRA